MFRAVKISLWFTCTPILKGAKTFREHCVVL
uniref:Uncharacterized protein n=1 Tax=Nelumbo nucifera TaxID=4432 RepID=A0A822YGF9_NELNU|nr:TPA_asm: hypothetical protein HUJ06_009422 [Nelumbo nucifera]